MSLMLTEAILLPPFVGLNFTAITQLAPAATVLVQEFVCEKSSAFVPVNVRLEMFSAAVPLLVSVTL